MADIHKAGLLWIDNNRILLCRKKGMAELILPGGRIEPGESEIDCLRRELREELGDVEARNLRHIGTYLDIAARSAPEPLRTVQIELYGGEPRGDPVASSEITDLVWFGPRDDRSRLAPSIRNKIIPDLLARGILGWPVRQDKPGAPDVRERSSRLNQRNPQNG